MKKEFYIFLSMMLLCAVPLYAQLCNTPKYEYRAVWLTTVENLDWPNTMVKSSSDIPKQKKELIVLLDSLKDLNVNTVMLQTRVRGDVIYPSLIEPFSHVLTGVEGRSPGYDPLAFAIEECHKRGMQLHAWIVTMPLGKDEHIRRQGKLALSRKSKELCTHYKGEWFMEPGNPAVAPYLVNLVREIVSGYDVDGVHFDYIRYPDRTNGYPDAVLHRKYGKGRTLAAWRRDNITAIASALYRCVKELKPWVRVSCAPLGKYNNLARYRSLGWDAYNAVYQDAQAWVRDGIMDALFPMIYFDGNNFYPFVLDWQENSCGRHIVPGIGIYRLMKQYGGWPQIEIERQLNTSRSAGTAGTAMFRVEQLLALGAPVYSRVYAAPALVPPMDWAGNAPVSPSGLKALRDRNGISVEWDRMDAEDGFPAIRYNVYGALDSVVDIDNIGNLLSSAVDTTSFRWDCSTRSVMSVAVTAVNAYGIESEPAVVTFGAEQAFVDVVELPELHGWGYRVVVSDTYGRVIYNGRYSCRLSTVGLAPGYYMIKVYDRHGALVDSKLFAR
ncbi:MAG: family 10 glycosylhydrolase [Bacteroidaceae bacterium]|nr:family 10 glycosylhydrolase [Bacteroidaceae bacterium]